MEEELTINTDNQAISEEKLLNAGEQSVTRDEEQVTRDEQSVTRDEDLVTRNEEPFKIKDEGICISSYIKKILNLPDTDIKTYSPLTLAFIGDSIFDLIIRTYVVESGNAPVNKLHHRCSKLVQAGAQAELYHSIKDMLTEEETAIFKRGRNAKSFTTAKNAGLLEYKTATGLEALVGYLYLTDRMDRIMELMKHQIENNNNNDT